MTAIGSRFNRLMARKKEGKVHALFTMAIMWNAKLQMRKPSQHIQNDTISIGTKSQC